MCALQKWTCKNGSTDNRGNRAARQYWRDLWHYRELFKPWKCRNGRIAKSVSSTFADRGPEAEETGLRSQCCRRVVPSQRQYKSARNHDGFRVAHVPVFARCRSSAVIPEASIWSKRLSEGLVQLDGFRDVIASSTSQRMLARLTSALF